MPIMETRTTTPRRLQPKLQIQLYLSAGTQHYFSVPQSELHRDSDILLTSDWKALWRCSHLISTDDGLEHLFLLTNAVTNYSIILVDTAKDLSTFLGQFQQHLLLAFEENGSPLPSSALEIDVQLITGELHLLNEIMEYKTDYAIELLLTNDVDVEATEHRLNRHENIDFPVSAVEAMQGRIQKTSYDEPASILEFPKLGKFLIPNS